MKIRAITAALAFAVAGLPLAAHADAPSGDFDQLFPISKVEPTKEQLGRHLNRNYVEHLWLDEQLAAATVQKTREQVRKEIASMPLPVVGA
jgi:hypothetical protein